MARERLKSPRARLFIALDLPESVRAGIVRWGREALSDPALRPLGEESLHITLAFLGYLPERDIETLASVVGATAAAAPSIELGDPVPLPPKGRPRLFALPAESPGAISLQAELEGRLVEKRLYKPEKRPFWPHVTLARVRREKRGSTRPAPVSRVPGALPKPLREAFDGVRVTLYRSELQPQGARYTPLAQVELPAEGQR
jgi:2'-5' RNA ligase